MKCLSHVQTTVQQIVYHPFLFLCFKAHVIVFFSFAYQNLLNSFSEHDDQLLLLNSNYFVVVKLIN